jgi:hypothetical protein
LGIIGARHVARKREAADFASDFLCRFKIDIAKRNFGTLLSQCPCGRGT